MDLENQQRTEKKESPNDKQEDQATANKNQKDNNKQ